MASPGGDGTPAGAIRSARPAGCGGGPLAVWRPGLHGGGAPRRPDPWLRCGRPAPAGIGAGRPGQRGPAGALPRLSQVAMSTSTGSGVLVWLSLDELPLARSGSSLLKMVSMARNTGEELRPGAGAFAGRFMLLNLGDSPVLTDGASAPEPTR